MKCYAASQRLGNCVVVITEGGEAQNITRRKTMTDTNKIENGVNAIDEGALDSVAGGVSNVATAQADLAKLEAQLGKTPKVSVYETFDASLSAATFLAKR
jgi:hypothetical protein